MDRGTTRRYSAVRLLAVSSVWWGSSAIACERQPLQPPVALPALSLTSRAEAPEPSTPEEPASPLARRCIEETPASPPEVAAPGPDARCPADPGRPVLRRGRVVFADRDVALDVELAETPDHQERGLMYRTEMADDAGMLFVFEEASVHSFWMRNTCIPLDMLFIAEDGLVVGIAENVPTMNDDSRAVTCPSRYVLEVNAGWCREHGVKAGMVATLELGGG